MNLRELISRIITGCSDVDKEVKIDIMRRDKENVVTHSATLPISYVRPMSNTICVEESSIKWREYL